MAKVTGTRLLTAEELSKQMPGGIIVSCLRIPKEFRFSGSLREQMRASRERGHEISPETQRQESTRETRCRVIYCHPIQPVEPEE